MEIFPYVSFCFILNSVIVYIRIYLLEFTIKSEVAMIHIYITERCHSITVLLYGP